MPVERVPALVERATVSLGVRPAVGERAADLRRPGVTVLPGKQFAYLVAAAAMVVDHIAAYLLPGVRWLRVVGRLAFPVFAAGAAAGYTTTRSLPRYLFRLLIAASAAQVFCLLLGMKCLNAVYTLAAGLVLLRLFDFGVVWGLAGLAAFAVLSLTFFGLFLITLVGQPGGCPVMVTNRPRTPGQPASR